MSGLQVLTVSLLKWDCFFSSVTKDPSNSVNILNHSVKVIGGVGKDKDIIGQNNEYFIN